MNGIPMRYGFWLILAVGLATFQVSAAPNTGEAEALVHSTIEQMRAAIERDAERVESDPQHAIRLVDEFVGPHVETELAGRLILGKHWREATEGQRDAFVSAFRTLLLRTYAVHVGDYANAEVEYLTTTLLAEDGSRIQVRTRVERPGKPPATVDYRMVATDHGWKVFDAVVNGISVVSTFRSAIDSEIRQYGIDGLIARLEEKNRQPLPSGAES